MPLSLTRRRRRWSESLVEALLFACAAVSVVVTLSIVYILLSESLAFFKEVPLSRFFLDREWTPLFSEKRYGIFTLVCGTFLTSAIALAVATPLGLLVAVYLAEYATPRARRSVKPTLEFLAGVPSLVYGYFALTLVTPLLQRYIPQLEPFNALSAGLVMGFMILPIVASLSEDAIYAVPVSLRDGAYALGYTRLQAMWKVVFPAALSGISASIILALSRAVGETMVVTIAAGQQPTMTLNPLVGVQTLTAYIVQVSLGETPHGTMEYHTIFVVGLVLFLTTFVLNSVALYLRDRFRSVYS